MIHFENIWNEAESMAKSYSDLDRKEILQALRKSVNDLSDSDSENDYHLSLGSILFDLCYLCAYLEDKKSIQINSASALRDAIERKRFQILNPEPPE